VIETSGLHLIPLFICRGQLIAYFYTCARKCSFLFILQMHDDFMIKTLSLVVMRLLFRKFRTIFLTNQMLFKWY